MKCNIITSMSRPENIKYMLEVLKSKDIIWHIITDETATYPYDFSEYPWIKHYIAPESNRIPYHERQYSALNWFFNNYKMNDEEIYGFLNDDDSVEETFFNKISLQENLDYDLIMVSMLRGDRQPPCDPVKAYGTAPLYAQPGMGEGGIALEQFWVKGKVFEMRLPNGDVFLYHHSADGFWAVKVMQQYKTKYLDTAFVLFNYFEPGRWLSFVP